VREVQYFGAFTRIKVDAQGLLLQADLPDADGAAAPAAGQTVHLHWDERAVHALQAAAPA
jgi:ABC-type Fe3+/spermidine/putrescine transport system ATPase subunit